MDFFSVFLKLKWYRTWKYYLLYVMLYAAFALALCGFSLIHLGQLYEGQPHPQVQQHTVWWFFLAVTHSYCTLITLAKSFQILRSLYKTAKTSKGDAKVGVGTLGLMKRLILCIFEVGKECAIPALSGTLLYIPLQEKNLRYCAAVALILTW